MRPWADSKKAVLKSLFSSIQVALQALFLDDLESLELFFLAGRRYGIPSESLCHHFVSVMRNYFNISENSCTKFFCPHFAGSKIDGWRDLKEDG